MRVSWIFSCLFSKGNELEFLAILIINVLVISDENWLMKQYEVVINLLNIWMSPEFHEKHRKTVNLIEVARLSFINC